MAGRDGTDILLTEDLARALLAALDGGKGKRRNAVLGATELALETGWAEGWETTPSSPGRTAALLEAAFAQGSEGALLEELETLLQGGGASWRQEVARRVGLGPWAQRFYDTADALTVLEFETEDAAQAERMRAMTGQSAAPTDAFGAVALGARSAIGPSAAPTAGPEAVTLGRGRAEGSSSAAVDARAISRLFERDARRYG